MTNTIIVFIRCIGLKNTKFMYTILMRILENIFYRIMKKNYIPWLQYPDISWFFIDDVQ